jgi:hypothetical protein
MKKRIMLMAGLLVLGACGFAGEGPGPTPPDTGTDDSRQDTINDGDGGEAQELAPSDEVDDFPYAGVDGELLEPAVYTAFGAADNAALCTCTVADLVATVVDVDSCSYFYDRPCTRHSDCQDNVFCNGEDRCGRFLDGTTTCYHTYALSRCNGCGDPPGDNPGCTPGVCIEEQRACIFPAKDSDSDGQVDVACGGTDCDDANPAIHTGAEDTCSTGEGDGNCNMIADEDGWIAAEGLADGDGLVDAEGASDTLHAIAAAGEGWHVAWLDRTPAIRFALTDGTVPVVPSEVYRPAGDAVVGDISIVGPAAEPYIVWSETGPSGSRIMARAALAATEETHVVFSSTGVTQQMGDVVARAPDPANGDRSAGVFFKMAALDSGESGNFEIFYIPVSDLAAPADPLSVTPIRVTSAGEYSGHPDAFGIAQGWIVVWEDEREGIRGIYATLLDFHGEAPSSPPEAVEISSSPADCQDPHLSCLVSGGACAVSWTDERYGRFAIFTTLLALPAGLEGLERGPEIGMTGSETSAWYPALAGDEVRGQFFLAYTVSTGANESDTLLNFAGQGLEEALEGKSIETSDARSIEPVMALSANQRLAVLWKEIEGGGASLHLKILGCLK